MHFFAVNLYSTILVKGFLMLKNDHVEKPSPNWLSDFIHRCDGVTKAIFRADTGLDEIISMVDSMSQGEGGCILLGAYCEDGYGSGFESVKHDVIESLKKNLNELDINVDITSHYIRYCSVYFIEVQKSPNVIC